MRTKLRDFRALPVVPLSLLGDADSAYGLPFFFLVPPSELLGSRFIRCGSTDMEALAGSFSDRPPASSPRPALADNGLLASINHVGGT